MDDSIAISALHAKAAEKRIGELAALLHACVLDGASISFILPFAMEEAEAFWRQKVLRQLEYGGMVLLVAESRGRIVGSVQLDHNTPPNQPHRAEVRKLLVHPDFRRLGIARRLMAELERRAGVLGRNLITLDTRTGDSGEPLYTSLGYQTVGIIPNFCRDTIENRLDPTTIMYKAL